MTTTRKLTITTRLFVRSHGSAPRGRGCWAFQASTHDVAFDDCLFGDILFVPDSTFTEAKAEASRHFAAIASVDSGVRVVAVLP